MGLSVGCGVLQVSSDWLRGDAELWALNSESNSTQIQSQPQATPATKKGWARQLTWFHGVSYFSGGVFLPKDSGAVPAL